MNKIIYLIAIFACMSMAYAEHNPTVTSNTVNLSTSVITPFTVEDYDGDNNPKLPDVIKGQIRDLDHFKIKLFEMHRDASHTVRVNLSCPEPVDGVDLDAHWYWHDTPPTWTGDLVGYSLNSTWDWVETQTTCWLSICVTKIDASAATTTGNRTFTAKVVGQYNGF